jgi:late competence protein required for DNA uptake (superfamily II DNA/RNA helicase)
VEGEKNEATATINELMEGVLNNNSLESTAHRKTKSGGKPHESNTACAKCGICHQVEPVRVIDGDYYCVNCQQKGPKAEAPTT